MDWPLFLSALLSATLLPGGSEALLLYRLHEGADPVLMVMPERETPGTRAIA